MLILTKEPNVLEDRKHMHPVVIRDGNMVVGKLLVHEDECDSRVLPMDEAFRTQLFAPFRFKATQVPVFVYRDAMKTLPPTLCTQ